MLLPAPVSSYNQDHDFCLAMTRDDNTGDISRGNLQLYDIFFHPADHEIPNNSPQSTSSILPDHIESVREGLLEMKNIVVDRWRRHLRKEAEDYAELDMGPTWSSEPRISALVQEEQHQIDRRKHSTQWILADKSLVRCLGIAKQARELLRHPEAEWNYFWRRHVFRSFSEEASRQPSFNPTLDQWSLYGEVTWTGFHDWIQPCAEEGASDRTMPKPDLTYAFPVQSSETKASKGFARDELLQTFSLPVLGKLVEQGLACTPTSAIKRWIKAPERTELSDTDKSCFPWAVVEMKRHRTKDKASIERCYCQAANGAAAALDMHAQLFRKTEHELMARQPPIITFTCIGPIVKVWLTYQEDSDPFQKPKKWMFCIWTTSVQLTWGVASLRAILMNMHIWASRLLKPKLQGCVQRISASLQQTSRDLSTANTPHTPSPDSLSSPKDAIDASEAPIDESRLDSSVVHLESSLFRTPQRQQFSVPEQGQGNTPTESATTEPQISSDHTQYEIPHVFDQPFHASDWTSKVFYLGPSADTSRSDQLGGLPKPPNSCGAGSRSPDSSNVSSDSQKQCTPSPTRPGFLLRTPQRKVLDNESFPVRTIAPSTPSLATARNRSQDVVSTNTRFETPAFSNPTFRLRSPVASVVSSSRSKRTNDLATSSIISRNFRNSPEVSNKSSDFSLDLSALATEIRNIGMFVFDAPQPASGGSHNKKDTDRIEKVERDSSKMFGTPNTHATDAQTSSDDTDDEATPRPSARSDNSRSRVFGISSIPGLSNAYKRDIQLLPSPGLPGSREQTTGLSSQNSISNWHSPRLNENNNTNLAEETTSSQSRHSDSGMKRVENSVPCSGTASVIGANPTSGPSQALISSMSSSTIESDISDDENDSEYHLDSADLSASEDSEYADATTDSDPEFEHEQDDEEEIRSWSGRSTESYRP